MKVRPERSHTTFFYQNGQVKIVIYHNIFSPDSYKVQQHDVRITRPGDSYRQNGHT